MVLVFAVGVGLAPTLFDFVAGAFAFVVLAVGVFFALVTVLGAAFKAFTVVLVVFYIVMSAG